MTDHAFTNSAWGALAKNKERIQKFKEIGDLKYIYQNELDKACFQHNMASRNFKDLPRSTAAVNVLWDKAFNIDKNPKYEAYQRRLASAFWLDWVVLPIIITHTKKNQLTNYTSPLLENLKNEKKYSTFINNTWDADLADMQLLSKFNEGIHFLLCVIVIHSKYAWVVPLKDKNGIKIINTFQNILNESGPKPIV